MVGSRCNASAQRRPISKLSCFAKILEKLINTQMRHFLSEHCILNSHQSGFRPGHSILTATCKEINYIIYSLDKKECCIALFIDLSKAFDSVDHTFLSLRLRTFGFYSNACNWFQNYLAGRTQAIVADGHQSDFLEVTSGV